MTITGSGFAGATVVDFGTNPRRASRSSATPRSRSESPAGSGTVYVTVTTPTGTSPNSPGDQFTYTGAPTVSGVSPMTGPLVGGTVVSIMGTNLANATAIEFGTAAVTSIVSDIAGKIVVISPAFGAAGPVDVTVTTPLGTSATSPADIFYYSSAASSVTGVTPNSGPPGGGTMVMITGNGFDPNGPILVRFGAIAATSITVNSTTMITATSPPGSGTVDVTVVTPGGLSATSPADQFTYTLDGPKVTTVARYGFHAQPTYLVISFHSALDSVAVQDAANYRIVGPGNKRVRVRSARYNPVSDMVTLAFGARLNLRTSYGLTINGMEPNGLRSRRRHVSRRRGRWRARNRLSCDRDWRESGWRRRRSAGSPGDPGEDQESHRSFTNKPFYAGEGSDGPTGLLELVNMRTPLPLEICQ